jgi:predicted GNAT family acetyltransferase
MNSIDASVVDDEAKSRLVIEGDGAVSQLGYRQRPGRLIITHTEVPEALRGRGIAGRLVRAAVARARASHDVLVPWCPYARKWLEDHPDVAATVRIDWTPPPTS